MTDESTNPPAYEVQAGEAESQGRREFLLGLGRWSKAVIGAALLGGLALPGAEAEAAWVNRRGGSGGSWANRRGAGGWANRRGGGGWANGRSGSGGSWVNGGGGWANRRPGGSWVNAR